MVECARACVELLVEAVIYLLVRFHLLIQRCCHLVEHLVDGVEGADLLCLGTLLSGSVRRGLGERIL